MLLPEQFNGSLPKPKSVAEICATWRQARLEVPTGEGRKVRAQLRRAEGATDALMLEVTHDLHARLLREGRDLRSDPETLAVIAIALAHLDHGEGAGFPTRMSDEGVSEARVDGLLRCDTTGELLRPLVRAIVQVGRRANAGKLASDIFYWSHTGHVRSDVRTSWSFEYYGAAPLGTATQSNA